MKDKMGWNNYWGKNRKKRLDIWYMNKDFRNNVLSEINSVIKKDYVVLDFGCGDGYYVKELLKGGYSALGVDISHSQIQGKLPFVQCSEKTPFKDRTFNLVIMVLLFEFIKDKKKFLDETKRIMKDNGKLLVVMPRHSSITYKLYLLFLHRWFFRYGMYPIKNPRSFFEGNGFEILSKKTMNIFRYISDKEGLLKRILSRFFNIEEIYVLRKA